MCICDAESCWFCMKTCRFYEEQPMSECMCQWLFCFWCHCLCKELCCKDKSQPEVASFDNQSDDSERIVVDEQPQSNSR